MKISKIYLRICSLLFACFLVCGSILRPVVTYASPYDLMIGSGSNALMTLELDDTDYMMMSSRSSIGTVTNTIESNSIEFGYMATNGDGKTKYGSGVAYKENDRYRIRLNLSDYSTWDGYYITGVFPRLYRRSDQLPPPGSYLLSFDFGSQFSFTYDSFNLRFDKSTDNAVEQNKYQSIQPNTSSGDMYFSGINLNLTSLDSMQVSMFIRQSSYLRNFDGTFAISFKPIEPGDYLNTSVFDSSNSEYQSDVSSSLSDLSSSVDSMTEDLSSAAQNLEYISTSQNLIIQGIDNVVMHISDQLFAFWNQLYNLIHVPTMAKMDDIISAIQNMDLEIEVNLDGLKQSIHQASQNEIANDNKISADQIANDEANTEEVKDAVKEHGNFIIDGLKGLFIPSDEFFKAYFDDLYAYFSDRFGFLSFPIDLVIRIADLFLTSEKVDAVLTLPSFEISGYKVWDDYSFNFTEFLETSFPFLISAIQTVTSIGLIMAFVNLCQDKWNEVMRS